MTRTCSFFLLIGLSVHLNEARPLSDSGCACKSGCDKSLRSSAEWCYVETLCKAGGWDSCGDTQRLYKTAVKEKQHAEQQTYEEDVKLKDAERNGAESKEQLATTKAHLQDVELKEHDVELKAASLEKKLAESLEKAASSEKKVEKAEHRVQDVERNATDLERRAADLASSVERKTQEAVEVERKGRLTVAAKLNETEQKLIQAQSMQDNSEKKLQDAQHKLHDAEGERDEALSKQREQNNTVQAAQRKVKDAESERDQARIAERRGELTLQDTDRKMTDANKERKEAQRQLEEARSIHNEDALKLSAAELKVDITKKQLKKSELHAQSAMAISKGALEDMAKFRAASEKQIADISRKEVEAEKRLKQAELKEKDVTARRQEVEKKHVEVTKKFEDAEKKEAEVKRKDEEVRPLRLALRKTVRNIDKLVG